jgi:acyl carrier protein
LANVIAIIGLAGQSAGEPTVEAFWSNFCSGTAPVAEGSGLEPRVSRARLFRERATEAIEDAAYTGRLDADRTGLFASGDAGDSLATEVASELGLRGPVVVTVDLSAVIERAVQSLRAGECDLALVGEISKRDEGARVVALKRLPEALADGDRILAVIRGSADQALAPPPAPFPQASRDAAAGEPGPVHERPGLGNAYVPPTNHLEAAIAGVWQEELRIDRVGVEDNFFELGGTSIAGVKIIALLREWLHQDIPTVSLYEGPTVSALAKVLLHSGPPKGYDAVRERGERRRRKLQRLGHGARQDSAE